MSDIRIVINGEERYTGARSLSYEWVVSLAWMSGHPTVTYSGPRHGDTQRSGTMHPGCADLEIEDGMIFNIAHTGNG